MARKNFRSKGKYRWSFSNSKMQVPYSRVLPVTATTMTLTREGYLPRQWRPSSNYGNQSTVSLSLQQRKGNPKIGKIFVPLYVPNKPILSQSFSYMFPLPYIRTQYTWYQKDQIPLVQNCQGYKRFDVGVSNTNRPFSTAWPTSGFNDDVLILHKNKINPLIVDLTTLVGEGKPTLQMLKSAVGNAVDFYSAVKRGDAKKLVGFLAKASPKKFKRFSQRHWRRKTLENRWLEVQYGWAPLMSDMQSAFQAFTEPNTYSPPMFAVQRNKEIDLIPTLREYRIERSTGRRLTKLYFRVDSVAAQRMAQWNILNNPLLTAWELVPYSFVVDWFIPIGDFLKQFNNTSGLKFISGSQTYSFKGTVSYVVENKYSDWLTVLTRIQGEMQHMERRTLSSVPIAFPIPEDPFGVKRLINAIALISQKR